MASKISFFLFILFVLSVGTATYGYAASGTELAPRGEGAQQISGWVVSDINYQMGDNAADLRGVAFSLDRAAGMVRVSVSSVQGAFYHCQSQGFNRWYCETPGATLAELDELRVLATQ